MLEGKEPPSFLTSNPFINILRKRGKEPPQTYQEPPNTPKDANKPTKQPKRNVESRTRAAPQKRLEGGQPGNQNAKKRKPVPWPSHFDMKEKDGMKGLFRHFIEMLWKENVMDARLGGCLNNSLRVYAELEGWIVKTPLQIIQAQQVGARSDQEAIIDFINRITDAGLRNAIVAYIRKQAELEGTTGTS